MTNDRKYALFQKGYRPSRVHATKNGQTENPLPRCVHASLHEGLSVCPSEYPSITPVQKKKNTRPDTRLPQSRASGQGP